MLKCYVILYTCTMTRGILLDLVKDGNAKTLINSLRTLLQDEDVLKGLFRTMLRYFPLMKHRHFVLVKVYHGILIYRRFLGKVVFGNDL